MIKVQFSWILVILSLTFLSSCENLILGPDIENNPVNNFNLMWKNFDRYYPSFIARNINWDSLYPIYRNQISNQITDESLWDVIAKMLSNLNDPHVWMYNRDNSRYFNSDSVVQRFEFSLRLVEDNYLKGNFKKAGEGNLVYGKFEQDSIGYIFIVSFGGDNLWSHDIDNIVMELMGMKSIIIDIRDNLGGIEPNCNYIGGAFIKNEFDYLIEKARNGPGHNDFGPSYFLKVKPRSYAQQFTKKIVLLTNRTTVSTAEVFAILLKQLPYSTQIGDTTAGAVAFSNKSFMLLNGWTYHMPQGICLSLDGQSFEGKGITPDFYVRNYDYEIDHGHDTQLEYAIQYLSR